MVTHSEQLLVTCEQLGNRWKSPSAHCSALQLASYRHYLHISHKVQTVQWFSTSSRFLELTARNSSWFCCCLCFLCLQGFGNLDKYLLKWSKIQIWQILESRPSVTQWRMLYMTTWETGAVQTPVQFDMKGLAQCTEDSQFLNATDDILGFSAPEELQEWTSPIPQSNGACTEQECPMERISLSTWRRNLMAVEACSPDLSHTRVLADVCITALHCLGKGSEPHLDCSGFRELLCFSDLSTWQGSASVRGGQVSPAIWSSQPAVFGQNQVLWFRWKQR